MTDGSTVRTPNKFWVCGGSVAAVALIAATVGWFLTSENDDGLVPGDSTTSPSGQSESSLYTLNLARCNDLDWSAVEDFYTYEDDSWREEIDAQKPVRWEKEGIGQFNCEVILPIQGSSDELQTVLTVFIETFETEAEAAEAYQDMNDGSGRFQDHETSEVKGCKQSQAKSRHDESIPDAADMEVNCIDSNMVLGAGILGAPLTSGELGDLDDAAAELLIPMAEEALVQAT